MELNQKLKHYRISTDELKLIESLLKREMRPIEWALFSSLWSEHCSYKSSKVHLRKFSYRNSITRDDSGENAGMVDLGYGEKIIFKMESHNHPSFIEPFQGAATGVGGILRDIFTMGARPIALADFLCFGQMKADRMPYLAKEVVHGISSYGNCVGVPTITGYTEYDSSYDKNILVNAMAIGLVTEGMPIASSMASGVGNYVVYVGAKTGKDGVHGAAMASESFAADNEAKKPNIQIGDPFYEKLLIESCLEVLQENLVVAIQDMGAAGLTSSSFEMAAKGHVGFDMHLDQVPVRDSSITPEEILLSESQERMLLVCEPKKYARIVEVFQKWDLDAAKIGEVNNTGLMRIYWKGEVLTSIDPQMIVESAPKYERAWDKDFRQNQKNKLMNESDYQTSVQKLNLPTQMSEIIKIQKRDEFFQSKEWIYRQYDQRVGVRTIADATRTLSVLRLPSQRDLAMSVGCRPAFMKMNTLIGAIDAILYPALQMSIKGFKPLAVTDCLNFGNPERLEVMTDFVTTVNTFSEMAQKLDAPVISGNVSFYNETLQSGITPTPAVGLVGLKENDTPIPECVFNEENLEVYLLQSVLPRGVKGYAKNAQLKQQEAFFSGELVISDWVEFASQLRLFVQNNQPKVTRVVGQGGLAMTLEKMNTSISLKEHSKFFQSAALMEEKLYDFVFAVEKNKKDSFERDLQVLAKKMNMQVVYLGFTHKGDTECLY